MAPKGKRFLPTLSILAQMALSIVLLKFNRKAGRFDPEVYKQDVADNSDFRKFDDGLKMTIDVDASRLQRIEALLEEAARNGVARYGLHRQKSALMTCFVPTPLARDHMHFIDGASGGYAVAASQMTGKTLSALNVTP